MAKQITNIVKRAPNCLAVLPFKVSKSYQIISFRNSHGLKRTIELNFDFNHRWLDKNVQTSRIQKQIYVIQFLCNKGVISGPLHSSGVSGSHEGCVIIGWTVMVIGGLQSSSAPGVTAVQLTGARTTVASAICCRWRMINTRDRPCSGTMVTSADRPRPEADNW